MKKVILLSIHKQWIDKIFNREKLFEFRNKIGKDWTKDTKVVMYECKRNNGCGAVVGEFTIGCICELQNNEFLFNWSKENGYTNHNYAIEITNVIKYDTPKTLNDFVIWKDYERYYKDVLNDENKSSEEKHHLYWEMKCHHSVKLAPQSFCYVFDDSHLYKKVC